MNAWQTSREAQERFAVAMEKFTEHAERTRPGLTHQPREDGEPTPAGHDRW